jgi:hypothetical protein
MAKVTGSYYLVTFLFEDVNGHYTRTSLNVDNLGGTLLIADVISYANDIATDMQAISGASLRGYNVTLNVIENDPSAPTEQGEDKALFSMSDDLAPVNYTLINVPGCPDAILMANGIDIDQTNANVVAFVTEITTAHLSGAKCISAAGGDLSAVEAAYLSQRRSLTRRAKRAG